jgi:hypothetical protein
MKKDAMWKKGVGGAWSDMSAGFADVLKKLHEKPSDLGEIRRLKQLHSKDTLKKIQKIVQSELEKDWHVKVFSGYIDHYPRAISSSIKKKNGVELADLVLLRSIRKVKVERRALLIQAKSFGPRKIPAVPKGGDTNLNDPAQRYLLENLPPFELKGRSLNNSSSGKSLGCFDVAGGFSTEADYFQHSRYLLIAENHHDAELPPGHVTDMHWWSALPKQGSRVLTFADTLASFVMKTAEEGSCAKSKVPVGRNFSLKQSGNTGWDGCISALIEYCSKHSIKNLMDDSVSRILGASGNISAATLAAMQTNMSFVESFGDLSADGTIIDAVVSGFEEKLKFALSLCTFGGDIPETPNEEPSAQNDDEGMHFLHFSFEPVEHAVSRKLKI